MKGVGIMVPPPPRHRGPPLKKTRAPVPPRPRTHVGTAALRLGGSAPACGGGVRGGRGASQHPILVAPARPPEAMIRRRGNG